MDRRTKYTKNVIRESLLEIMEEKEISKVTVTEICEIADINRATFYKYYLDVYDLLKQIEDELFEEFKESLGKSKETDTKKMVLELIKTIGRNKYLFKVLLSPNGNKDFLLTLMYYAREQLFNEWEKKFKDLSNEEFNYVFMYVANGLIAVSQLWVKNDCIEPAEDIANFIIVLINEGTNALVA